MADVLRFIAVMVAVVAGALIPGHLLHRIPGWRAWVMTAMILVLLISAIARTLHHLGDPIVWYGAPSLLVAGILGLVYALSTR